MKEQQEIKIGDHVKHCSLPKSNLYVAKVSNDTVLVRYAVSNIIYSVELFKYEVELITEGTSIGIKALSGI